MKTLLTTIIFLVFIAPCFSQQDLLPAYPKEITYRGDIAYLNGSPFTGLLVDKKTNKQLGVFRNGYKNGLFTEYFNNGKKKTEVKYSMGIKDDIETEWYETGQKSREVNVKNGLPNGILHEWNTDGSLKTEISYVNGKIVDGDYSIFNKKGVVIGSKSYKNNFIVTIKKSDGQYNQFYESGKLKYECHLNENGNQDGSFVEWWENGSKKTEGFKNDGKLSGKLITWDESAVKTSVQFFNNGKKDSIAVFWEEGGIIRTQYYKNDILIKEEIKNQTNLISNISLSENEQLYYYLSGEENEKTFVLIKIIDKSFNLDNLKKRMGSNLLSSIQSRLVKISNKDIYNNEYISYTLEISDLKYFAEGEYDSEAGRTMYTGNCSYTIKLFDNQNNLLKNSKFDSRTVSSVFIISYADKNAALSKGVKKASFKDLVYKYFPIKTEIIEIMSFKNDKAKMVKISAGSEFSVKRKLKFSVYNGEILKSSVAIGELEVTEVNPTYSVCKVTQGKKAILSEFNSNQKLKLISKL